jgi:hypothetical protein
MEQAIERQKAIGASVKRKAEPFQIVGDKDRTTEYNWRKQSKKS